MNESGTNNISKRLKILLRMSKVACLILGLIVILSILGYVLVDSDSEKESENLTTLGCKVVIEIVQLSSTIGKQIAEVFMMIIATLYTQTIHEY